MAANGHDGGFTGAMVTTAPGPGLAKATPTEQTRAFEPGSIAEALQMAQLLVKSRLMPDTVNTPEAAFAIIATGRELGLTAMQSLRSIHVIKGKTILSADLVCALVKSRRDVCTYFQLVESTADKATYETQRVGEPKPTTMSFTLDDAKRAGLGGGDNWRKYPAAMLRARCITALARAVYPDLAMGIYDPDEIDPAPAATPAPTPAYEVVAEAKSNTAAVDGFKVFLGLCDRVDAAETAAALNAVAKDAQKAQRAGSITEEQIAKLARAVREKRAIVAQQAKEADAPPPPPASEPDVEQTREPGEEG